MQRTAVEVPQGDGAGDATHRQQGQARARPHRHTGHRPPRRVVREAGHQLVVSVCCDAHTARPPVLVVRAGGGLTRGSAKRWSAVSDGGEDHGAEEAFMGQKKEESSRQFWKEPSRASGSSFSARGETRGLFLHSPACSGPSATLVHSYDSRPQTWNRREGGGL